MHDVNVWLDLALKAVIGGLAAYGLHRLSVYLTASGLGKKIESAEIYLEHLLTSLVGEKTADEIEQLLVDELAPEVSRLVHLPVPTVVTIGRGIIAASSPRRPPPRSARDSCEGCRGPSTRESHRDP